MPARGRRAVLHSRHRERRIQQHIRPSYLHDAIFGPRHFAGHRIIAAEHPGDLLGGMWAVIAAVFVVFQDAARLAGHVPAASAQADLGRYLHWPLFFWRVTAG